MADKNSSPSSVAEWGAYYAGERKESIVIPIDKANKEDMVVPVCLNGYLYQIQRGVKVELPVSVVEVLRNAGYIS